MKKISLMWCCDTQKQEIDVRLILKCKGISTCEAGTVKQKNIMGEKKLSNNQGRGGNW